MSADKKETSVPIGAWKCTFPPFSEIMDRQTNRQTDRQAHMKVPIINDDDSFKWLSAPDENISMSRKFLEDEAWDVVVAAFYVQLHVLKKDTYVHTYI